MHSPPYRISMQLGLQFVSQVSGYHGTVDADCHTTEQPSCTNRRVGRTRILGLHPQHTHPTVRKRQHRFSSSSSSFSGKVPSLRDAVYSERWWARSATQQEDGVSKSNYQTLAASTGKSIIGQLGLERVKKKRKKERKYSENTIKQTQQAASFEKEKWARVTAFYMKMHLKCSM